MAHCPGSPATGRLRKITETQANDVTKYGTLTIVALFATIILSDLGKNGLSRPHKNIK